MQLRWRRSEVRVAKLTWRSWQQLFWKLEKYQRVEHWPLTQRPPSSPWLKVSWIILEPYWHLSPVEASSSSASVISRWTNQPVDAGFASGAGGPLRRPSSMVAIILQSSSSHVELSAPILCGFHNSTSLPNQSNNWNLFNQYRNRCLAGSGQESSGVGVIKQIIQVTELTKPQNLGGGECIHTASANAAYLTLISHYLSLHIGYLRCERKKFAIQNIWKNLLLSSKAGSCTNYDEYE